MQQVIRFMVSFSFCFVLEQSTIRDHEVFKNAMFWELNFLGPSDVLAVCDPTCVCDDHMCVFWGPPPPSTDTYPAERARLMAASQNGPTVMWYRSSALEHEAKQTKVDELATHLARVFGMGLV